MKKSKPTKTPKMNQNHVKRDTVIAKNYVTRKHTVKKPNEKNKAWNEYLLDAVKSD